jgi:putative ABC transport system ATP-binding protein
MSDILRMRDVGFAFPSNDHFAIHIAAFSLAAGERVLLLGPSGSGKSTTLNLLSGVLRPEQGEITFAAQDLCALSSRQLDRFRGEHIGLIHQTFNLIPWLSAAQNIALGLAFATQRKARLRGSVETEVTDLMNALGLPAELYADQMAAQLSIGQQQRVGAARALIGRPELILADEPTSALDPDTTADFMQLLTGSLDPERQALIMVSHDHRLADHFTRTIYMADFMELN